MNEVMCYPRASWYIKGDGLSGTCVLKLWCRQGMWRTRSVGYVRYLVVIFYPLKVESFATGICVIYLWLGSRRVDGTCPRATRRFDIVSSHSRRYGHWWWFVGLARSHGTKREDGQERGIKRARENSTETGNWQNGVKSDLSVNPESQHVWMAQDMHYPRALQYYVHDIQCAVET